MKICRFDNDRLGVVEGDRVLDVTGALDVLPKLSWPLPGGDLSSRTSARSWRASRRSSTPRRRSRSTA